MYKCIGIAIKKVTLNTYFPVYIITQPNMKNILALAFTLLSFYTVNAQNSNKNFNLSVTVPMFVDVTDITTNQDKTFDNSKKHFFKYQQMFANFKNINISNNRFSGTYVSDQAFTYRDMINMSGEFNTDRKMIKWITIESLHHIPANYSNLYWSIETVKFKVSLQNIPLSYANKYSIDKAAIKSVEYESRKFIHRSHNRTEKYEEMYEMTGVSNEKHLSGYVDIDNCIDKPLKAISIGFLNDNNEPSKKLELDLMSIFGFQIESGNILLIERSKEFGNALEQEISITDGGLVGNEQAIDAKTAKANLLKDNDLTIVVHSNVNKVNADLIDFVVELNTSNEKQEIKKTFLNNDNLSRESIGFAALILNSIKKIQQSKLPD